MLELSNQQEAYHGHFAYPAAVPLQVVYSSRLSADHHFSVIVAAPSYVSKVLQEKGMAGQSVLP
jgi:hypothetical protein